MQNEFVDEFNDAILLAKNALLEPKDSETFKHYFGGEEVYDQVMKVMDRISRAGSLDFTMAVIITVRRHSAVETLLDA